MINISECKKRRIYKLLGRNLRYGVFDGCRFLGIREKFGFRGITLKNRYTGPELL